jgi:TonB family protein
MQAQNKLNKFILGSLLFHGVVMLALLLSSHFNPTTPTQNNIEVSFIDETELQKEIDALNAKTIVETDSKAANKKLTETAKFLSEKSNTVEKETRAKSGEKFKNTNQFKNQIAQVAPQKAQEKQSAKRDIFATDYDPYSALNKKMDKQEKATAEKLQQRQLAAQQYSEASTTNDNLQNIENEFMTRLNTKEYKYFGYYNRIKTQLNQWWVPQVQQKFNKMMKQGRSIASEESKITKLVIVLNGEGNLVKVQVLAESGIRDLDEAAIEAFRQAAPFPNPPKGMIDSDGTVKIRWDCVVES